jgi:predicted nucleic acid-binding protein
VKKVAIDANMLISFVTDRNLDQQKHAARLFDSARHSHLTILCHQNVLTEFVYVLDRIYRVEPKTIHAILNDLIAMPGVEFVNDLDYFRLLSFWPEKCPDYGDAVLLAFCKGSRELRLATFDRKFIRIAQEVGVKLYEHIDS